MGFLDKAKKLAEKAAPLVDKAAPHARTAVDKAGQQIDKRTGGKYHTKIEQVGQMVGDYADKRMAADGTGSAAAGDGFPPAPPPATGPAPADDGFPPAPPADNAGPTGTTPAADNAGATGSTPPPTADPNPPADRPTP